MLGKVSRAALTAVSAAALGLAAGSAAAKEYKVGMLLPYSSVYASLGGEIEDGFKLAVQLHGSETDATFSLVREDTEVKPPVGLAKARKLVLQDRVDVMVGVVSSGVLGAVRDFVHGAKVPLIVANAGNDTATGAACSPYITRISFSNSQINRPMGTWMAEQGIKKVYTLAPDYAAGRQMIDAFTASFEAGGGEVVGSEFTPFRKTKDFGPYLTKAKAANPDAIYVFYAGGEAIGFVKQYESFGINKDIPLYGAGWLTSPLYVAKQGTAAMGVTTALNYTPGIDSAENKAFVAAFKETYGRGPSEFAMQGFDAGRALIEASKTGAESREELAAALSKVSFTGPRGPLEIDPATNNIVQNIYVYKTVAGADGPTQEVLGVVEAVRDEANGCTM